MKHGAADFRAARFHDPIRVTLALAFRVVSGWGYLKRTASRKCQAAVLKAEESRPKLRVVPKD